MFLVTESEIWRGIVKAKQPELHCLFFLRRFKNLDNDALNVEKTAAKRYIDNIKTPEKAVIVIEMFEKKNCQYNKNCDNNYQYIAL